MDLKKLSVEDIPSLTIAQVQEAVALKKTKGKGRLYHHFNPVGKALRERLTEPEPAPEPEVVAAAEVSEAATEMAPLPSGAITGREFIYRVLVHIASSEEGRKDFHWIWAGLRKPYQAFMAVNRLLEEWGMETPPYLPSISELGLSRDTGEPLDPQKNGLTNRMTAPQVAPQAPKDIYDEIAGMAGVQRGSQGGGASAGSLDGPEGFGEGVDVPQFGGR
ncbi:MAG: hypothetical protein GY720_15865 [bacterium]|nr:hypothetical protein [bacterium]